MCVSIRANGESFALILFTVQNGKLAIEKQLLI